MFGVLAGLLLFTILPIAVIIGAVSATMRARRADLDEPEDEGIGSVRRLFIYALALIGATFAAVGISMIIGGTLDALVGDVLLLERREGLAVALAFTVVGTPAWLLFMLLAQRSVASHAVERRSQARRLYFALARTIAVSVAAWGAIDSLEMVLGIVPFTGGPWGRVVAWSAVWFIHQRLASGEPAAGVMTRLIDRLALYYGALLGLLLLIGGATGLLSAPLSEAYDRFFRGSLLAGEWDRGLRSSIALVIVGAVIWAWHWLVNLSRGDRLTTLWRVHVFLFGALLGFVLTIVPAATTLDAVLEWFLGVPNAATAAAHFSSVPGAISAAMVGVGTWGYHRAVLAESGGIHARSGPERVYRYLLAAGGLVTLSVGTARLIALAAEGLSGARTDLVVDAGWWRNPLLMGITLIVVGLPVWARYWRDTQLALTSGVEERAAPSRRVYVFGTVGVAIFALLVSLTTVLYQVFQAVLAADVSLKLLLDARWGLGVALTAGAVAYYHFLVLREDQAALPDTTAATAARRTRQVVLVAPGDARVLVTNLEGIDGVRVRVWRRTDADGAGALSEDRRRALRDAVAAASDDRLLAIVTRDDFELVPYVEDAASR